jgi:hypothetical protein
MVDHIVDECGKCTAYIEWSVVDSEGKLDDKGEYCFVEELWIWKGVRGRIAIIRGFINKISGNLPQLKFAYWKRHKYNGRVKVFKRMTIYGKD